MSSTLAVILTLIFIVIVATLVIKKYNPVFVFLVSGMLVLLGLSLATGTSVLGDKTTGSLVIDVFTFAVNTFKSKSSGIGMILMMVTGYAVYMSHIGASTKLAYLAMEPLKKIKNPYIILSVLFILGAFLKMVITSHVGLAMLLMAVAYPILIELGISKLSAACALVMSGFLDWGPNDSSAIFAAENVSQMPMMEYFIKYQAKHALILIAILAVFLPIFLSMADKRMAASKGKTTEEKKETKLEDVNCPTFYAVLPLVPLILITISSFVPSVEVDVATGNFIGIIFVFAIELIRKKDRKATTHDFKVVLQAMGTSFVNVVSILIAAGVFAEAVTMLGGITIISNGLASVKSAKIITVALMSLITFLAGILLGSGNASWYAFGPLVPEVTSQMGVSAATIALPMQFAPAIGRCMSPVAGVVIAISGMIDVDSMDIVKRCAIPSIVMFICNILVSQFIV